MNTYEKIKLILRTSQNGSTKPIELEIVTNDDFGFDDEEEWRDACHDKLDDVLDRTLERLEQ